MLYNYNILFSLSSIHTIYEVTIMKNKIEISKKQNVRGEDGYKTFSVRVPEEIVEQLDVIAGETNRSRNALINIFLEYGVQNFKIVE